MRNVQQVTLLATWMAVLGVIAAGCLSSSESPEQEIKPAATSPVARPAERVREATRPIVQPPQAPAPVPSAPQPVAASVPAGAKLIADFNTGQKPNALGGDFGAWDKDPSDPTQSCKISFDKIEAFGGAGYSLKIDYDVDSPNPAYNGFWMKLEGIDISQYKQLSFFVKGDAVKGFTPQIKLELKNTKAEVGRYLLKNLTDKWQQVSVPLSEFVGLMDPKGMTELVVVFDDMTSTKKVGTVYIDEITFE